MVSSKLLQAGIIIASFFILVTAFQSVAVSVIFVVMDLFVNDTNSTTGFFLRNIFTYGILFLISVLILRHSSGIASWLNDKSQYTDQVKINLNYSSIFAIILVSHSFFRIAGEIPYIITSLVEGFGAEISGNDGLFSMFDRDKDKGVHWLQMLLNLVMYGVIIYYAKTIAKWFSNQFGSTDEKFSFEEKGSTKPNTPFDEDEY